MASAGPQVDVSVVICAYTMRRWHQLRAAVASVLAQSLPASELIVVIDHCAELFETARELDPRVQVIESVGTSGLSGARNTGVVAARSEVVAFLDDDAVADPGWLAALCRHFDAPDVQGVGGHVVPRWESTAPTWLPPELWWVVGCSYRGLPTSTAEVRNPIGANMSFRRSAVLDAGGFSDRLGRVGTVPVGCEETELAIRIARMLPSARFLLEPRAVVHHDVPDDRARWSYLRRRCWAEGLSKARVSQLSDPRRALSSERSYVARTLSRAVARELTTAVGGPDPAAAARLFAISAGLGVTAVGYLTGSLATRLTHNQEEA